MDFSISEGNSIRLLAPFADMVNHSSDVNQCHAYDPNSGDLSIYASKDYQVDDQVESASLNQLIYYLTQIIPRSLYTTLRGYAL